jgi:hypothetical protein
MKWVGHVACVGKRRGVYKVLVGKTEGKRPFGILVRLQAQWSLYAPHSGHYMYRTVVTICTAQWSLYAPHSGHYMYRPVVTICTAQWSLYVPHSGHYLYRPMVTICTTSLTFTTLRSAHTLYLYVLCGSQNKQPLFPYTRLTDWFL